MPSLLAQPHTAYHTTPSVYTEPAPPPRVALPSRGQGHWAAAALLTALFVVCTTAIAAQFVSVAPPDCSTSVLLTGVDADGDGLDDRWLVIRPGETTPSSPSVITSPNAGWRGADPQSEGPFLSESALPELGEGRWIDGGHPDGPNPDGGARADQPGLYTFVRRFDLADRSIFAIRVEWNVADELVEVRLNGTPLNEPGCDDAVSPCAHDYIDNRDGALRDSTDPADNARRIHRLEITDPALFNFTRDAGGNAWNTIEVVVRNRDGGAVGLLMTAGFGTSVRSAPVCESTDTDVELPVYFDGATNWAGNHTTQWAILASAGQPQLTESFTVVELDAVNRGLLEQLLPLLEVDLLEHTTTGEDVSVTIADTDSLGRFLYLYQVETDVPCLEVLRQMQTGGFDRVGLIGRGGGFSPPIVMADAGDLGIIDARSRAIRLEPPISGPHFGDRFSIVIGSPPQGVVRLLDPPGLAFEPSPPLASPCRPLDGAEELSAPYGDGFGFGEEGDLPGGIELPLYGPIVWGTSDRAPVLLRHELEWRRSTQPDRPAGPEGGFRENGPGGESAPIPDTVTSGAIITMQAGPGTNQPPAFEPAGPFVVGEGEQLGFEVRASDPDGDPIVIRVDPDTLPEGAQFNAQFGGFIWRPDFDQQGEYQVSFEVCEQEATDSATQCATMIVEITVVDTNRPPEIVEAVQAGISTQQAPLLAGRIFRVVEGQRLDAPIFAIDPDGDPIRYGALNLPVGARFDEGTRTLSWHTKSGDAGTYRVTAMASDGRLNAFAPVTIEVLPNRDVKGGSSSGCSYSGASSPPGRSSLWLAVLALCVWRLGRRRLSRLA